SVCTKKSSIKGIWRSSMSCSPLVARRRREREMKIYRRWVGISALVGSCGLFSAEAVWAQASPGQLNAIKKLVERVKTLASRLHEPQRRGLSGGAQNLLTLSERFDEIEPHLRQAPAGFGRVAGPQPLAPQQVSDPSTDVAFSSFSGFTQSETSAAWCGNNVVV